ncbi:MAG: hypothetical protein K2K35_11195 [Lachnospiraceae bacterium]|nr:hypothetical protein [Lachnospiraceae bacterium]
MDVLRISCIVIGIILLLLDISAYVRQRLADEIGLLIGSFSIFLIIMGIILYFHMDGGLIITLLIICFCFLLLIIFSLCTAVSVLVMKNRELAMQVSLLNQENERIIHETGIMAGAEGKYSKDI